MSLTAEESAALAADEPNATDTDTPASGEQSTEHAPPEQASEGAPAGAEEQGAEGEPKTDKAAKPEEKQAWRVVELAKREQVKVARARETLTREVERVQNYVTEKERHFNARAQELEQRESKVKPLLEALESRDLNKLIALGFDYDSFTRDRLDANTPEGMARRALERAERLEREREEERKRLEKEREEQNATQEDVRVTREMAHTLVSIVDEASDDYPHLFGWSPERIAREGLALRDAHRRATKAKYGEARNPTYEQVLARLEQVAKAEDDTRQQRTTALRQRRGANPRDAGSAGKVDSQGASGSPNAPALSGSTANERPPAQPRQKTEAEIDEECLADLRALTRR